MLLFFSYVPNFTQNVIKVWPKFDEDCWNYHMIPVHSRAASVLPSGAKNIGVYFAFSAIIFSLIWLLFCLSLENRYYLTYM